MSSLLKPARTAKQSRLAQQDRIAELMEEIRTSHEAVVTGDALSPVEEMAANIERVRELIRAMEGQQRETGRTMKLARARLKIHRTGIGRET
jgi:hypothetical protein